MKRIYFLLAVAACSAAAAQPLYFPPLTGSTWESVSPASLGWCEDRLDTLYTYLEDENTKAFLILQDGKIAVERYFGQFTRDSLWYWASAGKTVTAFLVGKAQEEGFLSIQDSTSEYLGTGWTSCTPAQEGRIKIWHQLTMTSGLDDEVADPFCTLDTCLVYKADPGTRWSYHNGPYTLLDQVVANATGISYNTYYLTRLRNQIGMNGSFLSSGYNNLLITNARSMARFGLLILNGGVWNGTPVMNDTAYFRQMITRSQEINPAYGYLWWLNGTDSFMVPQTQFVFPGSFSPHAPADMFAALGKNGQIINVVPSRRLVVVRMGNAPDNSLVPFLLNDEIWQRLNPVFCNATSAEPGQEAAFRVWPNPSSGELRLEAPRPGQASLLDLSGRVLRSEWLTGPTRWDLAGIAPGLYLLRWASEDQVQTQRLTLR